MFDAADTLETCVFEGEGWEEQDDEEQEARRTDDDGVSASSMAFSFLLRNSRCQTKHTQFSVKKVPSIYLE